MNKKKPPRPSDTPPQEGNLKTAGMPTVPIYGGVAFASNDGVVSDKRRLPRFLTKSRNDSKWKIKEDTATSAV